VLGCGGYKFGVGTSTTLAADTATNAPFVSPSLVECPFLGAPQDLEEFRSFTTA
jgi:hypothetical protein